MTDDFDPVAHQHAVWTLRLILAELTHDDGARDIVVEEIGDCPDCWRAVATRAAFHSALYLSRNGEDQAVASVQQMLAATLDINKPGTIEP